MVFIAICIWKRCRGRELLVQLLGSQDAAEIIEQIVVGAGTGVAILVSIGTLIMATVVAAAAGGSTCGSMEAGVFIVLNFSLLSPMLLPVSKFLPSLLML